MRLDGVICVGSTKMKHYIIFAVIVFPLLVSSCSSRTSQPTAAPTEMVQDIAPVGSWADLLQITPVPYASPLPELDVTPLDGTYAKFDPEPPQWWACLRCADYRQAGGAWRMQFDRGVMRIYYEVTGWRSLASYHVYGDRLFLFNDPYCKEATGEYQWNLESGNLILEVINDPCSFELRGLNLSKYPWESCPQNVSADGEEPRGCTDSIPPLVSEPVIPLKSASTCYYRQCAFCTHHHGEQYCEFDLKQLIETVKKSKQKSLAIGGILDVPVSPESSTRRSVFSGRRLMSF